MVSRFDPFPEGPLALDLRADFPAHFGREAPLEVEIGFGYGHFLLDYAAAHRSVDLVGIEMRAKLAAGVARQAARRGLGNVAVIRGDARRLLATLFEPGSLSAVHVQFPDPWWKKRHHKRRIVDGALARLLAIRLAEGGRVYLRTDILDYARTMIATFEAAGLPFENLAGPRAFTADDGLGVPSNRERRYLASGTPVYRLVYRRRRDPALQI